MESRNILRYGDLQCLYFDGALRKIMYGNTEVLRMIVPAVRDPNWNTVEGSLLGEKIRSGKRSFAIEYVKRYREDDINYEVRCLIQGKSNNTISFRFHGKAYSDFSKNRIGINVLLPVAECRGKTCRNTTPSGEMHATSFPFQISPHQPMRNIGSLEWSPLEKCVAKLFFSGDEFEMEDQRNWTDSSYKIYSTPLDLPFPVTVKQGEIHEQEVILCFHAGRAAHVPDRMNQLSVSDHEDLLPFPRLGFERSSEVGSIGEEDLRVLGSAQFHHYRVELYLFKNNWKENLRTAGEEAFSMGLNLELAVFFDNDPDSSLNDFADALHKIPTEIDRILIYTRNHLNDDLLNEQTIPVLKAHFPFTLIGCGTNMNFAELNRNRPDPLLPDFLCYSVNPQVHAFDDLSLVENLGCQGETVMSTRLFAKNKPVCISPVTLRPRFNAVALLPEKERSDVSLLPFRYDPRQPSLFCAGWTLGTFKYLAEAGVHSITFYESAGRGGIIHGNHRPLSPEVFPAVRNEIYPVFYLLRELLKYRNSSIRATKTSFPEKVSSVMLENPEQKILILANHTADTQKVGLPGDMHIEKTWLLSDETTGLLRKGEDPYRQENRQHVLSLEPYATAFHFFRK